MSEYCCPLCGKSEIHYECGQDGERVKPGDTGRSPMSEEKQWQDLYDRAKDDIIINACLTNYRLGFFTKEQALLTMALALSAQNEEYLGKAVEAIKYACPPAILIPAEDIISAGWLAPCEGRKVYEGEVSYDDLDHTGYLIDNQPVILPIDHRIRLILDPLPEEGKP